MAASDSRRPSRAPDLLGFQIAIERARPGAVMTAYNRINGVHASGNAELLDGVLKGAWGYPGWAMSDWGAAQRWDYALAGLDQESGVQMDARLWGEEWFVAPLRAAFEAGRLPRERLSDMVRRILRSVYAVGADTWAPPPPVDPARHAAVALEVARQGLVRLKKGGVLPLAPDTTARVAVIGGHAQLGVPAGTASEGVPGRSGPD